MWLWRWALVPLRVTMLLALEALSAISTHDSTHTTSALRVMIYDDALAQRRSAVRLGVAR